MDNFNPYIHSETRSTPGHTATANRAMTWDAELLPVLGSAKWLPGKPWEIYFIVFLTSHVLRRSNGTRGIIPILLIVNDVQSFCSRWLAKRSFITFSTSFPRQVCHVGQRQSTALH